MRVEFDGSSREKIDILKEVVLRGMGPCVLSPVEIALSRRPVRFFRAAWTREDEAMSVGAGKSAPRSGHGISGTRTSVFGDWECTGDVKEEMRSSNAGELEGKCIMDWRLGGSNWSCRMKIAR